MRVEMVDGPAGRNGFRSGMWTATENGKSFKFFHSIPHCDGMNEQRLIEAAVEALDNGKVVFLPEE